MPIGLRVKRVGCRPKTDLPRGGRISRERGGGGTQPAGEGRYRDVRFQAYAVRGRSDSAPEAGAQAPGGAGSGAWADG